MWCPESTECGKPLVDIPQGPAVDRVQPPLTLGPHRGEAVIPQHFQVLRHRRLADRELILDGGTDDAGRQLSVGEQLENAPANRITQDIERVHKVDTKNVYLYKSSLY